MAKYLIIYIMLFTLSGCYYDIEEELYPATSLQCDTTPVTYAGRIAPLITNNCAISGCHVANAQSPDLSNYTNLVNNIDRVRIRVIVDKTMPPAGPLPPCDVLALQKWIDSGMVNN